MDVEYAIKLMKQTDTTICPDCLIKINNKCTNLVVCNKNLNKFLDHDYEKENSILLKCNEAQQIKEALKSKKNFFKINEIEFKNTNGELWKNENNNEWKKIF